jgi:hypothetical protein
MQENIIHHYRTTRSIAFHLFAIVLLLIAIVPSSAIAVDEAYLEALEAEAENSAHVGSNKAVNGASASKAGGQINKKELMQFEVELKTTRPATYRFYEKLDDQEKTAVFAVYSEDHKMTRASKTVFDLYFEKNK